MSKDPGPQPTKLDEAEGELSLVVSTDVPATVSGDTTEQSEASPSARAGTAESREDAAEGSSANTAPPSASTAAPSANGAAPSANTAAPSANAAAPSANTAAPSANAAAPSASTAAPSANAAAPSANTAAPSANAAAPSASSMGADSTTQTDTSAASDTDDGRNANSTASTVPSGSAAPSHAVSTSGLLPDETLIEYRPFASAEKWFAYRFSAFSTFKAWFATAIVVLFFGFGGPGWILQLITEGLLSRTGANASATSAQIAAMSANGQLLVAVFLVITAIVTAVVAGMYLSQPTHVSLSPEGVGLVWHRARWLKRRLAKWIDMLRIELFWPPGKTSPQDCLIRFLETSSDTAGQIPLALKLGAIGREEDRDKLLKWIQTHAGEIQRDPQLFEVLKPAQDHSYTELWLQALSAPPKRERLTPLSAGAALNSERFQIIDQLGVGGQGTAYLSRDRVTQEEVVLKEFILPVFVDINVRRQAIERMQNEASMLRRLDNPRIVRLQDFFIEDHRGYLVLEKIDGLSLDRVINRDGPLSEARVRDLALQMCEMLSYLHSLDPPVIHRDFTPDNLILNSDGILKLVDFNVAQQTEVTATGTVVGKHAYIPPEQFRGRPTTQSDIYAMGATLYYILTGEAPEPIAASHPASLNAEVSAGMDLIVSKATAFDTKHRYKSIDELKTELQVLTQ